MTYTIENDPNLKPWVNTVLNSPPLCLPIEWCTTLILASFGYKEQVHPDNPWRYIFTRIQFGGKDLFWNSIFSISYGFPFCLAIMFRWRATGDPSYWQFVIGWKPNGRFALTCRFEDDASSAAGMNAPNPGQVQGWEGGVK